MGTMGCSITSAGPRSALSLALTALVSFSVTSTTLAQESDERARLHFESGRSYYEEGAYERALEEFQHAYQLSQRPALLYNIGTTQERLGQWSEAADTFTRYLADAPDIQDRATFERRIANLRRRAENQSAETSTPENQTTSTSTSTTTTTTSSTASTSSSSTASGGGGNDGLIIGGIVGLGVGGAGLIAFSILGGLALSEQSAVRDGCFATDTCTPDDVAAMDNLAMGADISLVIGSVGIAAGAVLLILGLTMDDSSDRAFMIRPAASPTFAGLTAEGSF